MSVELKQDPAARAAVFAALAEPARLAIVDHLLLADASPSELRAILGMQSNLLAHHLGVLKKAGVVRQSRSEADGRRSYLNLNRSALEALIPSAQRQARRVVFVCSQNSARSQLAAAIWNRRSELPATSAGTHPAPRIHPGAVAAARRHKLHLRAHAPRYLGDVLAAGDLVIAVCDNAHEELPRDLVRLHWSVADPVRTERAEAFDAAVIDLADRIDRLVPNITSA
ncbi:arsenate reductase/protein-tyrosine-phosphatase family protein [Mycolicibacterium psychrotolerans]|uniref:Putative regulatory protein, ArsR family n=1 Tax=Mycolicibacterium psychrotolerans TaxID=216929 RepID=A0A7I7M9Z4_9MYCO|nr:helix-turn-helix domain-containing protein [Mycolicibacterium psychrotolerans]BBX68313.1 putative regulatory protein, ArsR family [Mycolicibacterium psychrotolerans]